jgi:arylformamidase
MSGGAGDGGARHIIDISPVLRPDIAVWPGDTPMSREVLADLAHGANLTLSTLRGTVHLGAHTDSPGHTHAGGGDIASQPLDAYIGRCQVLHVDVAHGARITPADLRGAITEPRVLLRTNTFPDPQQWSTDFASLSVELVAHLAAHHVRLVGIDTPSVDPFSSKDLPAHAACIAHDVRVLEGIVLDHVAEGTYELVALPLRLEGFDASPVRAILRTV